jgi:DDE superfamily endonuclease
MLLGNCICRGRYGQSGTTKFGRWQADKGCDSITCASLLSSLLFQLMPALIDGSCVWRWVQAYAPELSKRCRQHLKATNKRYRVDETYIKVKGQEKYLYRAVDSTGQTIDFLLTAKRDAAAAKRCFQKVFSCSANPVPRVINVDKNPAYPAAIRVLKQEGGLPQRVRLRQCKFLNNVIQQDHRFALDIGEEAKNHGCLAAVPLASIRVTSTAISPRWRQDLSL